LDLESEIVLNLPSMIRPKRWIHLAGCDVVGRIKHSKTCSQSRSNACIGI